MVGIVEVTSRVAAWAVRAEAAITSQIQPLLDGSWRWPVLRVAPVSGNVVFVIRHPRAGRIEDRWLLHNPGRLTFEPVVKPLKVRIAWPEIAFIDKIMGVGSNPQPLVTDTGLDVGKGR